MRVKTKDKISIKEAMDNLAAVASIHMESPPPIAIVNETRLITDSEEIASGEVRWLSGEGPELLYSIMDLSFSIVNYHLQTLFDSLKMDWESKKSKDGIAAMMSLVCEAAQKMNAYLAFRYNTSEMEKIESRASFRNLQRFYVERFAKKFVGGLEGPEAWRDQMFDKPSSLQSTDSQLKDYSALIQDRDYELFFITDADGNPYLNHKLLQNVKLTVELDMGLESFEDDPFLKVKAILDRDIQGLAKQIIHNLSPEIDAFFKLPKNFLKTDTAKALSLTILAIFLAANPKHLLQSSSTKTCQNYFQDFHKFFRALMRDETYEKWVSYGSKENENASFLMKFINKLSFTVVTRHVAVKQEAIGLIHRSVRKGRQLQHSQIPSKTTSLWGDLLIDDEQFRALMHKFNNGPLLKILDQIRNKEENETDFGFDPWRQDSLPSLEFTFKHKKAPLHILSLASPVIQKKIDDVVINPEFFSFLRHINEKGSKIQCLLVNLQDRDSWQESARAKSIEALSQNTSFAKNFTVITLPRNSDFYHQDKGFINLEAADKFLKSFSQILQEPEKNGFYFPKHFEAKKIVKIATDYFPVLHKYLFDDAKILTRQNREDFIEIFYQILILKIASELKITHLSFASKDSCDSAAFMIAELYAIVNALNGKLEQKETLDFLKYLFYWKALSIRERVSDPEMFIRSISALQTFCQSLEKHTSKFVDSLELFYEI